ncbi:MAG: hypothetical protein H6707_08320 [Deltaproteobacteria bacterium]|nr:hypothetical protein [Deltaproteobacteria bacterium]
MRIGRRYPALGWMQIASALAALASAPSRGARPPADTANREERRTFRPIADDPAQQTTVLYLNLEGATTHSGPDDSRTGQSSVCAAKIPAFDHRPYGDDAASVASQLTQLVQAYFADFDLQVVSKRPTSPQPYQMLIIGGDPGLCGLAEGLGGLAPLDCQDSEARSVGFVFSAPLTELIGVALVAAHEAGHLFGLPHLRDPCDVMTNALCPAGTKAFVDTFSAVAPDHEGRCGLREASSYQWLHERLGPAPPADQTTAGCNTSHAISSPPIVLLLLIFWRRQAWAKR